MITSDLAKISPKQLMERKTGIEQTAARFKLIGGRWHNNVVRLYAPWDVLKFPDGSVYELHAPVGKSDAWVYVNNMEAENAEPVSE